MSSFENNMVALARTRPLTQTQERTLANWNDVQVRAAWAAGKSVNRDVLHERLSVESDPGVLKALMVHIGDDDVALGRLCGHEDINVALQAALHPNTSALCAAKALKACRARRHNKTERYLQDNALTTLGGKDDALVEVISHYDLEILLSVLNYAVTPKTQAALVRRIKSLSKDHPRREHIINRTIRLDLDQDSRDQLTHELRRAPGEYTTSDSITQLDKAKEAQQAKQQDLQEQTLLTRKILKSDPRSIVAHVQSLRGNTQAEQVKVALGVTHDVPTTLTLLCYTDQKQRTNTLMGLISKTKDPQDMALLLEAVTQGTRHPYNSPYQMPPMTPHRQALMLEAYPHLTSQAARQYTIKLLCERGGEETLRQVLDMTKGAEKTLAQNTILGRPEVTLTTLLLLPSASVQASRHGAKVVSYLLENISPGAFEVYATFAMSDRSTNDLILVANATNTK